MTKKTTIITGSIVLVMSVLVTIWVLANNSQIEENNKSVWQIIDEINRLRDLKQECSDNLNIEDSAKFLKWMAWYCDSRDEEIKSLREQANEMQKKWYEKALGLAQNR